MPGRTVAVLGVGTMGAGMARSALRSGISVTVWNRSSAKAEALAGDGAQAAGSVGEAVKDADCVITMLYDAEAVLTVADELVANAKPGALWLQCATIGLDGITRLAHRADDRVRLVDAPVLGTKSPAEKGELVVLTSGPKQAVDDAVDILDAIGKRTVYVDEQIGHATALKLACNGWLVSLTAAAAQSLTLTQRLGVDPRLFLDVIKGGTQDAPYLQRKGADMIDGNFAPAFALDAALKDVELLQAGCRAAGVPTDLADALHAIYARSSTRGHGQDDIAAVRAAFDRD